MMKVWVTLLALFAAVNTWGQVNVTASVDRNQIAFGESAAFTITIQGVQGGGQPAIPAVDGLTFAGPATQSSFSFSNGQQSRSLSFTYQVTPTRMGEFTIPAVEMKIGDKTYTTQPVKLVVAQAAAQTELKDMLFARVMRDPGPVFVGQTAPLNVVLFVRNDVPLHGLSGFQAEAPDLDFKNLNQAKQGSQVINGVAYNLFVVEGAITPTRAGNLTFGPAVIKCQLRVGRRDNGDLVDQLFGRVQVREASVVADAVPIEVLPLPTEGKPADFTGAVGQWNLEVTAKPTEVAMGDPITLTVKVSGAGNIDTVPAVKLTGLEEFKTYDPTTKTTKNDLNTQGERVMQQVLVARSTDTKQLPGVQLSYFDPVAKTYKTAIQPPIPLVVKAGGGAASTIVSGGMRVHPKEKLGQDIVYLKGDLGPVAAAPLAGRPMFWALNFLPVVGLLGAFMWKRRQDKLSGDIAYARRSRAARNARKILSAAGSYEQLQHALQAYLGDRLNIPASGITASIVDEQLTPRGIGNGLGDEVRKCFETCDAARFAGVGRADVEPMKGTVEKLIDELENTTL